MASGGSTDTNLTLAPFAEAHAETVVGWISSADELEAWASRRDFPPHCGLFRDWHRDREVHPYVLFAGDRLCAYGEVWEDREEDEAELARIVVAPSERGGGLGRALVRLLVAEAAGMGFRDIWVRVIPWNAPALACYESAGFIRTTADEESRFNRGQPYEYVWLQETQSPAT